MLFRNHFIKYYLKYGIGLLIGIGILIAIGYVQLQLPKLFGEVISTAENWNGLHNGFVVDTEYILSFASRTLMKTVIYVFIVALGRFLWRYALFGTARMIENEIRVEMFNHALKLDQEFYSTEKVGGLMTYFVNDLNAVREIYGSGILTITDALFMGIMGIVMMFQINPMLTLYAAIPLALISILLLVTGFSLRHKFKFRQEAFESLSDFTQESFSGLAVIKAFVTEWKEALMFTARSKKYQDKSLAHIQTMMLIQASLNSILTLTIIVLMGFGAYLIATNQLSTGDLTAFFGLFLSLMWPMRAVSRFVYLNSQAQASGKRIAKFLDSEVKVFDNENAKSFDVESEISGNIEFRNLTLVYPNNEKPALKSVSFSIKAGQMVGLIGRTGSGKTTIVDTITRVHNVPPKTVFIGNHDIMDLPLHYVRNMVGYVPQDNFLYSDTIRDNIAFSNHDMEFDEVVEAAKLSDVYANIMDFRDEFDTVLGERGSTVSGGQKQRISIARAMAKNPDILILDDSVSAVDTKTEETIITNLKKTRKNKTTILIAHRISTVKKMDTIILLDDGEIVGQGNHQELMKNSELYQDMVRRQDLEKLIEDGGGLDG